MREAPNKAYNVDEFAPLTSWKDTTFRAFVQGDDPTKAQAADFCLDDLNLDDDVREELSGPYGNFKFRVFNVAPRPVIIVYEDGEEPLELARWVVTYKTNMRAIDEDWDEERRLSMLPRKYQYYMVDDGAMFVRGVVSFYAQDAMLEYRASRLMPKTWGWGVGRPPCRPMCLREKRRGGAERAFFSFWRPWTGGGHFSGGTQAPNRPSTWGYEIEEPSELFNLSCELERAQLGGLVMEWSTSPEAKAYRRPGHNRPVDPVRSAKKNFDRAYKELYRLRKDQIDDILDEWIPRFKKLSLIKAQGRQED